MSEEKGPFFIIGAQRSGTTMLRLMLNRHSRLSVPFESVFIPEFYRRMNEFGDLSNPNNMSSLLSAIAHHPFVRKGQLIPNTHAVLAHKPKSYADLIHAIFCEVAHARGKLRWGDKTPSYVLDMDVIWKLFPGCRFVHLIRDGRDVAMSLSKLSWGSSNLIKSARDWAWKVTLGRKMGAMIPGHYLEVHYEDLVRNPATTLDGILAFLGEPYEDAMLRYHENAESEMPTESIRWHRTSIRTPDADKAQAWKKNMTTADVIVFEQVAGRALDLFGYEHGPSKPTIASRISFAKYALLGHA